MYSLRRTAATASPILRQATRTYAAQANVQPPIQLFGVDGTYATALYTASAKQGSLDSVTAALQKLTTTLQSDKKVAMLIGNPTLSQQDKKIIVEVLSKAAGGDKAVGNLLSVMADNNRLGMLPQIAEAYNQLISAGKGEVEVTITSAAQLDSKVIKQLETSIGKSKFAGQGKKLKVQNKVKPEILGGLVVEIGDRTIDLSVQNKITKLNKMLTDAI
ncbi:OSCP/delta subunit of ATPase [Protomyces lactucae-debilis]|uniref:ATP synthase subunit 5, mitochondrial n=1 Tax=Protomyces lactucae-debilis TaxID=2754530 RepID=A0A1Y2FDC1_PROLT|nr:OSCP/delta subunit of ATPase [Protomyces lactucae-debilis]ORY80845.1 OSCP/delta subunit of ATPase [Protomyces lactucae-debilis]